MKRKTLARGLFVPIGVTYLVLWALQYEPFHRERSGGEDLTGLSFILLPIFGGILFTLSFVVTELVCLVIGRVTHRKVVAETKMIAIALLFTAVSVPMLLHQWTFIRAEMR